jgi:hypothetical protein
MKTIKSLAIILVLLLTVGSAWAGTSTTIVISPSTDQTGATDSANIANAISSAYNSGISTVYLTAGAWYIKNSITIPYNNIILQGAGASNVTSGSTIINSLVSGPAIDVVTSSTTTYNWSIQDLCIILPTSSSAIGIKLDGAAFGNLNNVLIWANGSSQTGLLCTCTQYVSGYGTAYNTLSNLTVMLNQSANAIGIEVTGSSSLSSSHNTFNVVTIAAGVDSQTLLWMQCADTNNFTSLTMYGSRAGIKPTTINFDYSVASGWPADTHIYGMDNGWSIASGANAIINTGTPGETATPNIIYGFGLTNGSTIPSIANLQVIGTVGQFTSINASGTITPSTTNGIVGTTLGDNANAGSLGEYVSNSATGVSVSNGTATNITSISLTSGDWDVQCNVQFLPATSTVPWGIVSGVSTSSAAFGTPFTQCSSILELIFATGTSSGILSPLVRENLSTTTTVYCIGQAWFTTSTMTADGYIRARRVR